MITHPFPSREFRRPELAVRPSLPHALQVIAIALNCSTAWLTSAVIPNVAANAHEANAITARGSFDSFYARAIVDYADTLRKRLNLHRVFRLRVIRTMNGHEISMLDQELK